MENAHANRFDIIDTVEIVGLQHDSSENKNLNVDSNTIPYNKYVTMTTYPWRKSHQKIHK